MLNQTDFRKMADTIENLTTLFINNNSIAEISLLNILHETLKLNRIIIFFSFIAFILNLICIIVFQNVFSFKVKYNIYLIFGPITDCICSVLFQIVYLLQELSNDNDFVCYFYTYFINPLGYTCYCLSLVISLVISIDR